MAHNKCPCIMKKKRCGNCKYYTEFYIKNFNIYLTTQLGKCNKLKEITKYKMVCEHWEGKDE